MLGLAAAIRGRVLRHPSWSVCPGKLQDIPSLGGPSFTGMFDAVAYNSAVGTPAVKDPGGYS